MIKLLKVHVTHVIFAHNIAIGKNIKRYFDILDINFNKF